MGLGKSFIEAAALGLAIGGMDYALERYLVNDGAQMQKTYGVNSSQAEMIDEGMDKKSAADLGLIIGLGAFAAAVGKKRGREETDERSKRSADKIWTIDNIDFSHAEEIIHRDDFDKAGHKISTAVYLSGPGVFLMEKKGKYYRFGGEGLFVRLPGIRKDVLDQAEPEDIRFVLEGPPHVFRNYVGLDGKGINFGIYPNMVQREPVAPRGFEIA